MKTRQEIKAQAKAAFMADYWTSVGVVVVYYIVMSAVGGFGAALSMFGLVGTVATFFAAPLALGVLSHFVRLYQGDTPPFETMFVDGFSKNYLRKVGGLAWVGLWTFLWFLLFIIPGYIKAFSYAMTPYILTRCSNVKATDAIKLSMKIMNGHKADLFVFYLSFLGWWILTCFTVGILGVFYVGPYFYASLYGYFDELFADALAKGIINRGDLGEYDIYDTTVPPQTI